MMLKTRMMMMMLLTTCLAVSYADPKVEAQTAETQPKKQELPVKDLQRFVEVLETLKSNYVDEISDETLIDNAIRGMISGLDPHSEYYDAKAFKGTQEFSTGSFVGIGVEVIGEDGLIRVISPMNDSPAQKAGIKAGDLIIKIDSTAVQSMDVGKAIDLLKGEPNSSVTLTIIREGSRSPITTTVLRDVIKTKSVTSELIDDQYAYVRLYQFQDRAVDEIKDAIVEMARKANAKKGAVKGMILDLRNNPGGVLEQAVRISDLFLNSGLIVYTQGRDADSRQEFSAQPGDLLDGLPLVVLINVGSASASEIVAGALQDQKRAVIVGEKSFGKGSVQVVQPLSDQEHGMKYTTARYYTPLGRSIQANGIIPDIELLSLEVKEGAKNSDYTIREENLAKHIENLKDANASYFYQPQKDKARELSTADNQLYEALNILKSLIYQNVKENVTP